MRGIIIAFVEFVPKKSKIIPSKFEVHIIRGTRVILDSDLARLYGVETRRLNEQVRRNSEKFPVDFVFPLKIQEVKDLISQNATSSSHGGRRKTIYAFTEHGAIMASMILKSEIATQMSVFVVRTFTKMRQAGKQQEALQIKITSLGKIVSQHDRELNVIIEALDDMSEAMKTAQRKKIAGFGRKLKTRTEQVS